MVGDVTFEIANSFHISMPIFEWLMDVSARCAIHDVPRICIYYNMCRPQSSEHVLCQIHLSPSNEHPWL